jgi:hypothetical protein
MIERSIGKKIWAFAAGHIPLHSKGKEPAFTSHDKIAVLNIGDKEAKISIKIFNGDCEPVDFKLLTVASRRIRKIRFNDLINPLPIPLDKPFGFLIISDVEVLIQFSRADTSQRALTGFCVTPLSR